MDTLALHSSRLQYDTMVEAVQSRRVIVKETRKIHKPVISSLVRAVKAKGRTRRIALYGCEDADDWDDVRLLCGDIELKVSQEELNLYR